MGTGSWWQESYLDGGTSKSSQLFDVRPLFPDDSTHSLGWDEEIHSLLLWVLEKNTCTTVPLTWRLMAQPSSFKSSQNGKASLPGETARDGQHGTFDLCVTWCFMCEPTSTSEQPCLLGTSIRPFLGSLTDRFDTRMFPVPSPKNQNGYFLIHHTVTKCLSCKPDDPSSTPETCCGRRQAGLTSTWCRGPFQPAYAQ